MPDPDAIFVGGAGRHVRGIVEEAFVRLRDGGRLVANVGSVENLAAVHECMQKASNQAQVWMVNVSRGTEQLDRLRFESLNPTFLVGAVKG